MNKKIVVALDGSPLAERALIPAAELALASPDGSLVLVRVLPPVLSTAQGKDLIRYSPTDEDEKAVKDYLAARTTELEGQGLEVATLCPRGYVADQLIKATGEADLLLMSSHGRSGFERLILGSVTEEVVRRAEVPVLVVRNEPVRLKQIKRILVPLDGSPTSENALPTAVAMASFNQAHLVLCRIIHTGDLNPDHPARQKEEKEAFCYLEEKRGELPSKLRRDTVTHHGSTARAILQLIREHQIDLVVMGTHQRRGLSRFFWGSVAENVVRSADCPVLLVPKEDS